MGFGTWNMRSLCRAGWKFKDWDLGHGLDGAGSG